MARDAASCWLLLSQLSVARLNNTSFWLAQPPGSVGDGSAYLGVRMWRILLGRLQNHCAVLSGPSHLCLQFCVGTIKDDYLGVISQAAGIV